MHPDRLTSLRHHRRMLYPGRKMPPIHRLRLPVLSPRRPPGLHRRPPVLPLQRRQSRIHLRQRVPAAIMRRLPLPSLMPETHRTPHPRRPPALIRIRHIIHRHPTRIRQLYFLTPARQRPHPATQHHTPEPRIRRPKLHYVRRNHQIPPRPHHRPRRNRKRHPARQLPPRNIHRRRSRIVQLNPFLPRILRTPHRRKRMIHQLIDHRRSGQRYSRSHGHNSHNRTPGKGMRLHMVQNGNLRSGGLLSPFTLCPARPLREAGTVAHLKIFPSNLHHPLISIVARPVPASSVIPPSPPTPPTHAPRPSHRPLLRRQTLQYP